MTASSLPWRSLTCLPACLALPCLACLACVPFLSFLPSCSPLRHVATCEWASLIRLDGSRRRLIHHPNSSVVQLTCARRREKKKKTEKKTNLNPARTDVTSSQHLQRPTPTPLPRFLPNAGKHSTSHPLTRSLSQGQGQGQAQAQAQAQGQNRQHRLRNWVPIG